jgi:hypothetical protein
LVLLIPDPVSEIPSFIPRSSVSHGAGEGRRDCVRAFPKWFERYLFADVKPALAK